MARPPVELARILAGVRVAAGLAFVASPEPAGRLLVGDDADSPGAWLFISAFGARDALLGAGTWRAVEDGGAVRPWLASCALADAFDAAATLALFRRLPRRRRALAFGVSLAPAVAGALVARELER